MSIAELLPSVALLPHADKFRLVQLLLEQLAKEEGVILHDPTTTACPVPVGRVYRSGRFDVSVKARSLLFESRVEALPA
ncbi:hypothetical protein [Candidatus Thiothrix anitrata]|uniref:Uncharacterized protein n=1 Tax=Candidatus Thiothrix anitrata TaxID=2823902 RepID=A0ABX7X337_9GAMM|nr:hypothetical protein [Candidatus Thiothrix anitrata]QTR49697.1 hypothetical protein J8380_15910 [Candidatus Thiothrix anitrata]